MKGTAKPSSQVARPDYESETCQFNPDSFQKPADRISVDVQALRVEHEQQELLSRGISPTGTWYKKKPKPEVKCELCGEPAVYRAAKRCVNCYQADYRAKLRAEK